MKNKIDYENKVDVVPVINVSLVVVLTLMLISPFLSQEEKMIDLPEARAAEVDDTDNIEITFTLDREIFVAEEPVALGEVTALLTPQFEMSPTSVAVIKADQSLPYGEVEQLIAAVEAARAPSIALATKEKKGGDEG